MAELAETDVPERFKELVRHQRETIVALNKGLVNANERADAAHRVIRDQQAEIGRLKQRIAALASGA
jgi:hypothetical protein